MISRRKAIGLAVTVFVFCFTNLATQGFSQTETSSPVSRTSDPDSRPPNIVLIISDDQAWTDYGFMEHPVIKTPCLDKLAKESYVFTRGYVPTSLCRPSLATIITGLFPTQHGITGNDPRPISVDLEKTKPAERRKLWQEANQSLIKRMTKLPTIPRMLKSKGYVSFQSGKWWEGNFANGGFDEGMTHGDPKQGGRHGDKGLRIGRDGLQPVFDFIDKSQDKPFFIWYAPFLPHTPHNPPEKLFEKYKSDRYPDRLAKYFAMCEWFDQTCGELVDYIDEKKLKENTVFIYVTDNGWIQRTDKTKVPEGWRNSFAPKSKQSPFDQGIRTPIMIRWPSSIEPKMDRATLASSLDLAPTILKLAGLEPTKDMQGIDLLPVAKGNKSTRKRIWGEIFAHDIADLQEPKSSLLYRWCIEGFDKVIEFHDGRVQRYETVHKRKDRDAKLFNLKSDPYEVLDVAKESTYRVRELREWISEMASETWLLKIKE